MSRTGKIARLPRELREQVNSRLDNGEPAVRLVEWLNGLPEVRQVLQTHFDGSPVTQENLSRWKTGGFRDWESRQAMLAQARALAVAADGRLTDHLATVLATRYAAALSAWNGEACQEFRGKLRPLRKLCQDIVHLRRGDFRGARLSLVRERSERKRERTDEKVFALFARWAANPAMRACLCQDWNSAEERETRMREILGLPPKTPGQPVAPRPDHETNPANLR